MDEKKMIKNKKTHSVHLINYQKTEKKKFQNERWNEQKERISRPK